MRAGGAGEDSVNQPPRPGRAAGVRHNGGTMQRSDDVPSAAWRVPAGAGLAAALAAGAAAGAWLPALAAGGAAALAGWALGRRPEAARPPAGVPARDLRAMLEALPIGVLALDQDRRILYANQALRTLVGVPPQRDPTTLSELIDHPGLREAVDLSFLSREPVNLEFDLDAPIAREVDFWGHAETLGGRKAIVATLHDNTEVQRLETVRQDFFANVSHELKTPLTAIRALTETLLDGGVDQPEVLRRFLGRIDEQSARLHALVIDMLTLARAESRQPGYVVQTFDVREVVRDGVEGFRPDGEVKGVRLAVAVGPQPCLVKADLESVQTILRNLVDNAVKYTPPGGEVRVGIAADAEHVQLTVSDTGVGIPEADLGRVFERFYRVDKARSRELGGTGLGLAIVKHLAQTFGGTVGVASKPDAGANFTVRWPRADPDAGRRAE